MEGDGEGLLRWWLLYMTEQADKKLDAARDEHERAARAYYEIRDEYWDAIHWRMWERHPNVPIPKHH